MPEFDSPNTDSARSSHGRKGMGNHSTRGRRRPPVDWQRINGEPIVPSKGLFGWLWVIFKWMLKWTLIIVLAPLICYFAIGAIGAWLPENSDFKPTRGGIEIFVYSGNAHSEFILPMKTSEKDWTETFALQGVDGADFGGSSHVAIGWGDRKLYTTTPQWSDLEVATAVTAMFLPTESVLHVEAVSAPYATSRSMRTEISQSQYAKLCQFIESTLADPKPIEGISFGGRDRFYPAKGNYHLFNTCNNWVGEAMKETGIKVGRFTPLPKTVFWHLEN